MRFNLRLLAAIWLPLVVVLGAFAYVSVERERARLSAELERRSWLLGEGLKEAVEPLIDKGPRGQIQHIVERFGSSARGVAVYDRSGTMIAVTSQWAPQLDAPLPAVPLALVDVAPKQGFQTIHNRQTYYYAVPLLSDNRPRGVLVFLSDASHIDRARWELAQQHLIRFAVLIAVLSLVTMLVVRRSVTNPLNRMAEWARQLRAGQAGPPPPSFDPALFGPGPPRCGTAPEAWPGRGWRSPRRRASDSGARRCGPRSGSPSSRGPGSGSARSSWSRTGSR